MVRKAGANSWVLVLASARRTEPQWKGCRMLHGFLLSRSHGLALVGYSGEGRSFPA